METGNIAMIRKARPYPSAKAVVPAVRNGTHRYADTLVAMKDGRVMARGPYTELLTEEPLSEVFGLDATIGGGTPLVGPISAYPRSPGAERGFRHRFPGSDRPTK